MQNSKFLSKLLFLVSIILSGVLFAQNDSQTANNSIGVEIDSYPKGVVVEISGNYTFVGRTPFIVPYPLVGKYKLKAQKEGYEGRSTTVDFVGEGYNKITIRLAKKTRFKAAIRSTIFPGWGQFYGLNKTRGFIFTTGQAALGIITALALKDYNNEKDDYELALENFNRMQSNLEEAEIAFQAVQKEFNEAQDAKNFKNTMLYIAAGFWFYNILDSIFFFSPASSFIDISAKGFSDLSGYTTQKQVMITMNIGL